jgi:hypothetical protein
VDPNEVGVEEAMVVGEITRDLELAVASTGSNTLFGGGTWANKGRYLRVGHSFTENKTWFSIRGEWLGGVGRHIYLPDYQRASASFRSRIGMGGVRSATERSLGIIAGRSKRRLKRY